MIAVSLPAPGNFGWGVAGENIHREIAKLAITVKATDADDYPLALQVPMLHAIQGVNLLPLRLNWWSDTRNVGYAFIEDSIKVQRYAMNATRYFDHVVAGSTWCQQILKEAGVIDTSVIIQGVGPEYFEVGPRPDDGKFIVFSGGKCEFRKGQDIVAKAMKVMMDRHKDVYLMAAWNNPWQCGGYKDILLAIEAQGLPADRVLGPRFSMIANKYMLTLYAGCDVGLFPNRCEAGNNMVMCEFMACGKPVIATYATGHKDVLLEGDNLNLVESKPLLVNGPDGKPSAIWVEPNLDEVIANLELAYSIRGMNTMGAIHRERMRQFTWEACAKQFYDILTKT